MNREILSTIKKEEMEPQINADERRFENFKPHQSSGTHSETKLNKSTQSTRRTQNIEEKLFARRYRKVTQNMKPMTRIGRIFMDTAHLCASASSVQSVFYPSRINHVSALIGVMPASMHRHVCPYGGIRGCALQRRDSGRFHPRLNESNPVHNAYSKKWGEIYL